MSIKKKALIAVGYATAPRATLFIRHPVQAVGAWAAYRAAKRMATRRRRRALAAATATAVALPIAWKAFASNGGKKR